MSDVGGEHGEEHAEKRSGGPGEGQPAEGDDTSTGDGQPGTSTNVLHTANIWERPRQDSNLRFRLRRPCACRGKYPDHIAVVALLSMVVPVEFPNVGTRP